MGIHNSTGYIWANFSHHFNDVVALLKQNLLKSFNTTDFLGISIPSLRGEIALSKVTGCIVRCLRRNEASDVGSSDNQSATAAAAARCLS